MERITSLLAAWYAEHGRSLPWRDDRPISNGDDATAAQRAYHVWLSEVILQQTTVRQGTEYYLRFTSRWPDINQLASATEDEILREWQGLGYYTRARNLYRSALQVRELGAFPSDYAGIRALPGVGDYTAAAIASIAYGLPYAVVDGNVYRVLARYFGMDTPIDTPAGRREYATLAQTLLDPQHPGRHNQAMMDFGALQCTPHSPRCETCPLADSCLALAQNRVEDLPVKARRTEVKEVTMDYCLVHTPSGLYLRQRPARGIWARLWELPTPAVASVLLSPPSVPTLQESPASLGTFHHQLTHRRITCHATALRVPAGTDVAGYQHITWEQLDDHALPRLIELIITKWRNQNLE